MDLLVKEYLRTHSFQELEDEFGVTARRASEDAFTKFSLNYDSILCEELRRKGLTSNPIAEQCRGLIVRPSRGLLGEKWKDARVGDVEVVAWPMNRFYNFGDPAAVEINWSDPGLRVYEKVDGTCIILYWDAVANKWHAATRSVPEANLPINAGHLEIKDMTFSQLFLNALILTRQELSGKQVDWEVDGPDKVIHLNKEMTYVFELVSLYNQIVVVYPKPRVYLLAARHTATGKEVPIETLRIEHVRRPKTWSIRSVAELAEFVDSASPSELEGAVVCDSKFGRMKIKNKSYVLAHKSKDTVMSSSRNALECVILEKVDDIVPLVPQEVVDRLMNLQHAYFTYCKSIDDRFEEFHAEAAGNRKRFAELVSLAGGHMSPFFVLWEKKAKNARDMFATMGAKGKLSSSALDTILSNLVL